MEEVRMDKSILDRNEHKHRQMSKWLSMLLLNARQDGHEVRLERLKQVCRALPARPGKLESCPVGDGATVGG